MKNWSYTIKLTPNQYSFDLPVKKPDDVMTADDIAAIAEAEEMLYNVYRTAEEMDRLADIDMVVEAKPCTEAIDMLREIFEKKA